MSSDDDSSKARGAGPDTENAEELEELVAHYRVCYELWPLRYPVEGQLVQVGFELDLVGTTPGDRGSLMPGQDRAFDLFESLGRIARYAVTGVPESVRCDFDVFDGSINYSKRRRDRPDVTLKIEIVNRSSFKDALEPAEVEGVHAVTECLQKLGVREGSWTKEPSH